MDRSFSSGLPGDLRLEQVAAEGPSFDAILRLRARAYGRDEAGQRDPTDDHSLHFVARQGDLIVGSLRVTCRCHGPLESESHYPGWLLDEFGGCMSAASRMCVAPEHQGVSSLPLELVRFAWRTVLPLGIRIGVSQSRLKAIPFYMKMGGWFIRDSVFDFERWNVRCALVAYPVNPNYATPLSDIFRDVHNPCDLSQSPNFHRFTRSYRDFIADTQSLSHRNS